MAADWDADSPQLQRNLAEVLASVRADARRFPPRVSEAKRWQKMTMRGLAVPDPVYVGSFRGESGLEDVWVSIGGVTAIPPGEVKGALKTFETKLNAAVDALDNIYPGGRKLDVDGLAAVIDLAAWAHSEWVRIHPFANGNGCTARIWANFILMRYGIPPVIRLRPRPDMGYAAASASAMTGDWKPTAAVFRAVLAELPPAATSS